MLVDQSKAHLRIRRERQSDDDEELALVGSLVQAGIPVGSTRLVDGSLQAVLDKVPSASFED
jgi:hypothetical protein